VTMPTFALIQYKHRGNSPGRARLPQCVLLRDNPFWPQGRGRPRRCNTSSGPFPIRLCARWQPWTNRASRSPELWQVAFLGGTEPRAARSGKDPGEQCK